VFGGGHGAVHIGPGSKEFRLNTIRSVARCKAKKAIARERTLVNDNGARLGGEQNIAAISESEKWRLCGPTQWTQKKGRQGPRAV
jgi:hypothetical protein